MRNNQYGQPIGDPIANEREWRLPEREILAGRYCQLEPLDVEKHAQALFSAYHLSADDRDWTYLFQERPENESQFRDYLQRLASSSDPLHFAVVDRLTGSAVGSVAFMRMDIHHGVLELGGINFSSLLQRRPAGTEAIWLMLRQTFDVLGYRRCEWKCDALNAPSKAAAERYGFRYEGQFRQAIVVKGRNRDTDWYSIIDSEWPTLNRALSDWLSDKNFSPEGEQLQSLRALRQRLI